MSETRRTLGRLAAVCCVAALAGAAAAQPADPAAVYPARAIRIVVPFPPGGPTDLLARVIGQRMTADWGQPVLIENRPGGNTGIGAQAVAKADPDGYTLLAAMDTTMVLNPLTSAAVPYDPFKDFTPVSLIARNMTVLAVRAGDGPRSIDELIARAKTSQGKLNFGTGTINSRLAAALLGRLTGTSFVAIPFKGSAETVQGLMSGSVDFIIDGAASSTPMVRAGAFRALAKLSTRPLPALPDVPSLDRFVPGFGDVSNWIALFAPAGAPPDIVDKIQRKIAEIYADPATIARLEQAAVIPASSTAAELAAFLRAETDRWSKLIRDTGVKVE